MRGTKRLIKFTRSIAMPWFNEVLCILIDKEPTVKVCDARKAK